MLQPRTAFAAPTLTLADLGVGDQVEVFARHACLIHGPAQVLADSEGDLFIPCRQGMHYLETLQGEGGALIGVSRAVSA